MSKNNDWRRNHRQLITIVLIFSAVGIVIGDEVFDMIYAILGIERPPWR